MSQYQLVAAIAQIPVTKLLKNVPSGLQATGEYEWDDYAQSLKAIQQNDYNVTIALSFIYSLMYIGIMLVVDILYGIIDPRIRLSKEDNHES